MLNTDQIMVIIAQFMAVIAIALFALTMHQKNKKMVLFYKLTSNIFFALEFLFLKAFSAVGTCSIDVFQNLIFYKYAKEDKSIPFFWLISYIIIISIIGYFTCTNLISIIPIVFSILNAIILWIGNLKAYRLFSIVYLIFWIIYDFSVSAYIEVVGGFIQLVSVTIAVYRFKDLNFLKNHLKRKVIEE